jgi:adenylate cyclase
MLRRLDQHPRLVGSVRRLRHRLPGDAAFGDPLSTAGGEQVGQVARLLAESPHEAPGVLRETGLGALQLWQSWQERRGGATGTVDRAIVFTDIVGFSAWSLEVGDDETLRLLRDVSRVVDPLIRRQGGEVVKWLGDGMMAVLPGSAGAVEAVLDARDALRAVRMADGFPVLRSGIHRGTPRRLGGDYLGLDVTVAARLAEAAGPGELLVSGPVLADLPAAAVQPLRVMRRSAEVLGKGVPADLMVYAVAPAGTAA